MNTLHRFGALMFLWFLLVGCENETESTVDPGDTNTEIDTESDNSISTDTDTDTEADTWDARFDEFAEALQSDLEKGNAYGISAAVMEGGKIVFAHAFGSKDKDGKEPLTPNTLMQIGSTTKQMTAAAFLRKVEKGLVSVDDTLEDAMPEFEFALNGDWDDQITLHHLLSHQSGIVDWSLWEGSSDDNVLASYMFESFDEEQYLMNPPGVFYNYSNPNFNIIGLLTEQLDTRPWPDIMTEDLFLPLGMDRTFARKAEAETDGDYALSFGYKTDTGSEEMSDVPMADQQDFAWLRPAGLVWTTPSQMMSWSNFIMHGNSDILSDELRGEITAEQVPEYPNVDEYYYGYGMGVQHGFLLENGEWYETPVLEHNGGTLSFTHEFYMLPEFDLAFSICISSIDEDLSHSVSTALATLIDLPDPSSPPAFEVDPSQFDNHVGVYNDPRLTGDIIVTRDGDKLLVEIPALSDLGYNVQSELVAVTSDIFMLIVDDEPNEFTFIATEKDGPSTYIRNRNFVALRVEETEAAAMRKIPAPLKLNKRPLPFRKAHAPAIFPRVMGTVF